MKKEIVMLVFCRKVIAKLFIEHIENHTAMEAIGVYEFNRVKNAALVHHPILALVEIPERDGDPELDAFDVCDDIKEACPACKIMLMCPEGDTASVAACEDAKQKGKIEDYIFYDTTPQYVTSKLKSLLPA